jgi:hypothetical protein
MDFYKCIDGVSSFNILLKASFGIVIFPCFLCFSCEIELFPVNSCIPNMLKLHEGYFMHIVYFSLINETK